MLLLHRFFCFWSLFPKFLLFMVHFSPFFFVYGPPPRFFSLWPLPPRFFCLWFIPRPFLLFMIPFPLFCFSIHQILFLKQFLRKIAFITSLLSLFLVLTGFLPNFLLKVVWAVLSLQVLCYPFYFLLLLEVFK